MQWAESSLFPLIFLHLFCRKGFSAADVRNALVEHSAGVFGV